MSWSLKLGRIAGIPIYVHWTFLILIGWTILGHWSRGHDLATTMEGVGFTLALFACVVLHELGHALAARRYGVATADITLLPIGGVARLQRIPEKPSQELVVALAGPAVNVLIAAALYLAGVRPNVDPNDPQMLVQFGFLERLLTVNVFLALFNLVPAFPMDGGRVLRALLALWMDYARATTIAAKIGQLVAIVFGFLGLSGNPMLLLIALFVWIGAEGEAAQVQERQLLQGLSAREAMLTDYRALAPESTLAEAAGLLLAGSQAEFPVLEDGRPVGVLTREALLSGLAGRGREARVGEVELAPLGTVEARAPLVEAVARIRQGEAPCLEVLDGGRPVGLLTLENVAELLMVRAALSAPRPGPGAPVVPRPLGADWP